MTVQRSPFHNRRNSSKKPAPEQLDLRLGVETKLRLQNYMLCTPLYTIIVHAINEQAARRVLAALRSTQQIFNKRMHALIINLSSEALQFYSLHS